MLKVKVFANGIRVKELELKNLRYFFRGMDVLSNKWKINSFTKIQKIKDPDLIQAAYVILIGLIYKYMCTKKGWEVNKKRFKNEILLKNKSSFIFVMDGEFQDIKEKHFDEAMELLKKCNLIEIASYGSSIKINNTHLDYCCKLGNYLFDTEYARKSIEDNTHYFGDHSSIEHEEAYKERKENVLLN